MVDEQTKKLRGYQAALMAFTVVLGFGDVVNNYEGQGLGVVTSWIIMIGLYMLPYSLMVGQLGSTFKQDSGGLSSWVRETCGTGFGYMAAWTYWVANIPYLAEVPQQTVISIGWAVNGNNSLTSGPYAAVVVQLLSIALFLVFQWVASRGLNYIKLIGTVGGVAMFAISMLFILLSMVVLCLPGTKMATPNLSIGSFIPHFNFAYLTTIALLIFSLDGCEIVSPYVTKMKNPSREFPRAMIMLAIMVGVTALLGSFSLGIFFDSNHIPRDLRMNGEYYAFQLIGRYFHVGNLLLYAYSIANVLAQLSVLVVLIDANIRILVADTDSRYIPKGLLKFNDRGTPVNGYILTTILVSLINVLPIFGIADMNDVYNWLLNLNAIVQPLTCIWIFYAFMRIRRKGSHYTADYVFIKNGFLARAIGAWLIFATVVACLFSLFPPVAVYTPTWWYELILNVLSPLFLIGLGFIMPAVARSQRKTAE
ncbi:MAG: amino acid permease [Sporolactobacillus sp.]|jgi:amino acid transporter|nr:amino acid permease [Sporolactobacillus sp.]